MDTLSELLPKTRWLPPSDEECLRSCIANAEEAERRHAFFRKEYDRLPVGDAKLAEMHRGMCQAAAEAAHWRGYVGWYRTRLASRPPAQLALPPPLPARLPYRDDVGADDDDETPVWYPEAAAGATP